MDVSTDGWIDHNMMDVQVDWKDGDKFMLVAFFSDHNVFGNNNKIYDDDGYRLYRWMD